MVSAGSVDNLSLVSIFKSHIWRISLTWLLVLLEAGLFLMFPLAIGYAIDELLADSYLGIALLMALGVLTLTAGAARRLYDTRIYAGIYARVAPDLVQRERDRGTDVSTTSARATLAAEFVEFLENALPEIINSAFGLLGALAILFVLNSSVFLACIVCTLCIGLIFGVTSNKIYGLNSGYNRALEDQVRVISDGSPDKTSKHFRRVARWSIRLSDLETANFSLSWLFLMGLLAYAIFAIIDSGATTQGMIFAVLMYVFNYIESVVALPMFYQQLVRLQEITHRLQAPLSESEESG